MLSWSATCCTPIASDRFLVVELIRYCAEHRLFFMCVSFVLSPKILGNGPIVWSVWCSSNSCVWCSSSGFR